MKNKNKLDLLTTNLRDLTDHLQDLKSALVADELDYSDVVALVRKVEFTLSNTSGKTISHLVEETNHLILEAMKLKEKINADR